MQCPVSVEFRPVEGKVRIGVHSLVVALVQLLLASRLQAVSTPASSLTMIHVEVQVVASTIWRGQLPQSLFVDLLLDWWHHIALAFQVECKTRLFSGPYFLPPGLTCQEVVSGDRRRTGELLLSVHPELRGGGTKEENKQWAKSRLATLCLSQGVELQVTTEFVESVVVAAGPGKLMLLMLSRLRS